MTAKEKAMQTVNKYYSLITGMEVDYIYKLTVLPSGDSNYEIAKQCAIKEVDEIIMVLSYLSVFEPVEIEYGQTYYKEVMQEIEKR